MSFGAGFSTGIILGSSLSRSKEHTKSVASSLYSIMNMEYEHDKESDKEEKIKRENNKKERSLKLDSEIFDNSTISEDIKHKLFMLSLDVELSGFYRPKNTNVIRYNHLYQQYKSDFYTFLGKYRCVAWAGDILTDEELSEINKKVEYLKDELDILDNDSRNIYNMLLMINTDRFNEIDFYQYDNIEPRLIEYICPEAESYIHSVLNDEYNDINRCRYKIKYALIKAELTLEKNQENLEKTLKYKISKLFKKNK